MQNFLNASETSRAETSEILFQRAKKVIPGGVNSPVRAFKAMGGIPRFIHSARGAYIQDVEGRRYIDYVGSWGVMILGHSHPAVVQAVQLACQYGLSYGAPCVLEVEMAEEISRRIPSMEQVRMSSSGTEATMTAIRLARGYTGRNKIIKFAGCYHGHADSLLVEAGSGALTLGVPNSAGVPTEMAAHTLVAEYNNLDSVAALFTQYGDEIAGIIVEPIAANMNLVLPMPGFLEGLRKLCNRHDCLLIFDEVITGFRVGPIGAQGIYQVEPDLTTLGKIIGGGMPIGAVGGRKEVMQQLAPQGPVYQAGTLSGNPIAMAAGLATLRELDMLDYKELASQTERLVHGIRYCAQSANVNLLIQYCGSLIGIFFTDEPVISNYNQVLATDSHPFKVFFHALLAAGVYIAPSPFEAGFVSFAHHDIEIEQTLNAVECALQQVAISCEKARICSN